MDYLKKFTEYCSDSIKSKKIEIPDKNLAQAVRRQEFAMSCNEMTISLKDAFYKEGKLIEEQALRENNPLFLKHMQEMQQIGDAKIKEFINAAEKEFLGIDYS